MTNEEEKKEITERLTQLDRVTRVTAGGRRFSFRALVIAGDKKGKVGMGIGKAADTARAINKATKIAIKKMVIIPLREGTIPFEIHAKFKMAEILLKPAPQGRGIVAGGVVRDICELGGIQNIYAKVLSASKSRINNAKGVLKAFEEMRKILIVKKSEARSTKSETNSKLE